MGSSGKRKTTFAKLARESKLRERRLEKQAKRHARKQRAAENRLAGIGDETHPAQADEGLLPADIDGESPSAQADEQSEPTEVADTPEGEER
jgi:hypothetical protein